jgi:hypothetical protein
MRQPAQDAEVEQFLTGCVKRWNERPDAPPLAELERQGRILYNGGCDDLLVRFFYGRLGVRMIDWGPLAPGLKWDVMPRQPSNVRAAVRPFLVRAPKELRDAGYDAAFVADAAHVAKVVHNLDGRDEDEAKRGRTALLAAIARAASVPGPYANGGRAFLLDDVVRWTGGFSAEDLGAVADALDKAGGAGDQVVWHLMRGEAGSAQDLITRDNADLTKAWELEPGLPEAATRMIRFAGSVGDRDGARRWFDRAVKARVDDPAAYETYLWVLHAPWHHDPAGSQRGVFDLGVEAAKGGRFDTEAPRQLVTALDLILKSGGDCATWERLGAWPEVKRVFDGYLAAPGRTAAQAARDRSAYAGLAARLGRYDEAAKLIEALGGNLDEAGAAEAQYKPAELVGDVRAHMGASAELAGRGDRARAAGDLKGAAEAYEKAVARAQSPEAGRHLRNRARAARWQVEFDAGDWVDLAADADLSGFVLDAGEWTAEPDGSLSARVTEAKSQLTPAIEHGDHWELSCDVAFLVADDDGCHAGLMLGGLRHDVNLFYNRKAVYVGNAGFDGNNGVAAKFARFNRVLIRMQGGRVTVTLNDREVVTQGALKEWGVWGKERLSLSGGTWWQSGDLVRFERVKIRKIAG